MQRSILENYRVIAGQLGLGLDEGAGAFTGSRNGWPLCIYPQNANYPYNLTIAIAAGRANGGLTREELGRWDKKRGAVSQKGNTVLVNVAGPAFRVKADAVADKLRTSLDAAAAMLTELGFQPVCASCGQPKEGIRGYQVQTDLALLCPDCAARTREALDGGVDGLDFYRAITAHWGRALRKGGRLIFEVGIHQAPQVELLMAQNGFEQIETFQDTGGIWRVVEGVAPN